MKNDITKKPLAAFGYSKYSLSIDGILYKGQTALKMDSINRYYIVDDNGKPQRITQKELYRKVYNKEFSIDNIVNLPCEEWKEILNTDGKYMISNCGRVKSLCGYTTKIL